MIKRGTIDPREGYNYAKAREDLIMNKSRENTGLAGTAVEALGGGVSAGGLAKAGVTAARAYLPEGANLLLKRLLRAQRTLRALVPYPVRWKAMACRTGHNAAKGLLAGGAVGYLAPGVVGAAKVLRPSSASFWRG
jgi:hypothetical protein